MNTNRTLYLKIFYACLIGLIALTLPVIINHQFNFLIDKPAHKHLVQSIFIGVISISGIWFLKTKFDESHPVPIGLTNSKTAIIQFLLGFGLIAVPLIITISASVLFDWTELTFNIENGTLMLVIFGLLSTFFTDAITEELIFRGYIYSNLKKRFNTWKSSIITLVLFVTIPIIISLVQKLFGIDSTVPISGGYVITLLFFGAFVQYLRVLTKSIWAGVGFHLFFVFMNQLIGITDKQLIQFSETSNQQPVQITLIVLLLLVFISLIAYPYLKKRKES